MICENRCSCGIISTSLSISGSGQQGDPWDVEANFGGVFTSITRPGSPVTGYTGYETDTKRIVTWDGTNWVITGGQMPGVSAYITGGLQSLVTATPTDVALTTEAFDTDTMHTGSNAFVTIPAGMAGDWDVEIGVRFAAQAVPVGQRTGLVTLGSNGSIVLNALPRASTFPSENTNNTNVSASNTLRLVAGAIVTLQGYQTSGGALVLSDAYLTVNMRRHIPSLV